MFIVAVGLTEIGHTYAGPFETMADVEDWLQQANINGSARHVLTLNTPKEVLDNLKQHRTEKHHG